MKLYKIPLKMLKIGSKLAKILLQSLVLIFISKILQNSENLMDSSNIEGNVKASNSGGDSCSSYVSAFEKFLKEQSAENDFREGMSSSPHQQPHGGESSNEPLSPCKCQLPNDFYFNS